MIFPIFAFLLFVVIDGGILFGRYNDINNAAKEGARLGAVDSENPHIVARVQHQVHGILDSANVNGCSPTAFGGAPKQICVELVSGPEGEQPGQLGSAVRVRIRYRYGLITPAFSMFGLDPAFNVEACAVQRLEQSFGSTDIPKMPSQSSCDTAH